MSSERELLKRVIEHRKQGMISLHYSTSKDLFKEIEAELAKPEPAGMTAIDMQDDDNFRFVQRVFESDAPESDRQAARDMIVGIRTRVRNIANPEAYKVWSPSGHFVVVTDDITAKNLAEEHGTGEITPLYTSPRPYIDIQTLTNKEKSELRDLYTSTSISVRELIDEVEKKLIKKNTP
jgi:hypothetical protein